MLGVLEKRFISGEFIKCRIDPTLILITVKSKIHCSILRVKDLRKNVTVLQEGGSTPAPPKLLVIRVVLLYIEWFVKYFNSPTVYMKYILF